MKRAALLILLLLGYTLTVHAQRPTGQAVSGCTSSASSPACYVFLVDANGVLSIQGVNGGQALPISGTVTATQGTAASAGWPVIISSCSGATCYTSGVNSGATVITSGSTSTLFASTTLLKSFRCNNASASAQTITITDGNNAYFVGPLFSMAALSNTEFQANPNGSIMTSGVKASASNGVAVTCWALGLQ